MLAERIAMRQVRDVLRLNAAGCLRQRDRPPGRCGLVYRPACRNSERHDLGIIERHHRNQQVGAAQRRWRATSRFLSASER